MLEAGKLPPGLLSELLSEFAANDPRVRVGPKVGEDCAVIEMGNRLLIAKSDPVTFVADRIGWYTVQVNANDIACTGGVPRWFLPTILLPPNIDENEIRAIFSDIAMACGELGVSVVGGHTEVSVGIPRPIVAGTMLGELDSSANLISSSGAQDGDSIIVTTGLAIEGTAILARAFAADLSRLGVNDDDIARAADYLGKPGISVVSAARALCDSVDVHSMHDVTEGGVITALREVAIGSDVGLVVEAESMPILPESGTICQVLGIDPLGLLGSGALVATLSSSDVPRALRALDATGVSGWEVGQIMEADEGLWMIDRTGDNALPEFRRDELARYLESREDPS
jgi:hydrogenase maturation factor